MYFLDGILDQKYFQLEVLLIGNTSELSDVVYVSHSSIIL